MPHRGLMPESAMRLQLRVSASVPTSRRVGGSDVTKTQQPAPARACLSVAPVSRCAGDCGSAARAEARYLACNICNAARSLPQQQHLQAGAGAGAARRQRWFPSLMSSVEAAQQAARGAVERQAGGQAGRLAGWQAGSCGGAVSLITRTRGWNCSVCSKVNPAGCCCCCCCS